MNITNIATCLFPTLFWLDPEQLTNMSALPVYTDILCNLIEHHEQIFRDEPAKFKIIKQGEFKSK